MLLLLRMLLIVWQLLWLWLRLRFERWWFLVLLLLPTLLLLFRLRRSRMLRGRVIVDQR